MANQQLIDYLKEQLKLGVSKEVLKGTLLDSGWPEADINSAFVATEAPAATPARTMTPAASTVPSMTSAGSSPVKAVTPTVTKDIFQSKDEPVFRPKSEPYFRPKIQPVTTPALGSSLSAGAASALSKMSAPAPVSVSTATVAAPVVKIKINWGKLILPIAMGVVIVGLAVGIVMLYLQNQELDNKLSAAATAPRPELDQQISSLTQEKNNLTSQINILSEENRDLSLNLSFVATSPGGASAPVEIEITGTIKGGDKQPYTLTTSRQLEINIKNYKDVKVATALKPLIGMTVVIGGNYVPGSREITVMTVNSMPIGGTGPTAPPPAP